MTAALDRRRLLTAGAATLALAATPRSLGVSALVNLSPDPPPEALFRSSVALEKLIYIENRLLRGADPFRQDPRDFDGLKAPKRSLKAYDLQSRFRRCTRTEHCPTF